MPKIGITSRASRGAGQSAFSAAPRHALAVALAALAAPAGASDLPSLKGCDAFLTVQSRGCSVSVLWQCGTTPDNEFAEMSFGPDGLETLVRYTASYQWLESIYTWDKSREAFVAPAADPINVGELIETGADTYDFSMRRTEPERVYNIRITGVDRLTGATSVIDGYTLDHVRTRLEITDENGTVEYSTQGTQYFSRKLGQFFLGTETVQFEDGERSHFDTTPVDIIEPGEPGFGSTVPLYECIATDAALDTPRLSAPDYLSAKEIDHDEV